MRSAAERGKVSGPEYFFPCLISQPPISALRDYAQVLASFIGSDTSRGKRFVLVGHSGGATTA